MATIGEGVDVSLSSPVGTAATVGADHALRLMNAVAARIDDYGNLIWLEPKEALLFFERYMGGGASNQQVPSTFEQIDAIADGALSAACDSGAPKRFRLTRVIEATLDQEASLVVLRHVSSGTKERRFADSMADPIRSALDEGRLKLYGQSIVEVGSSRVVSTECLARLVDEDGTVVPPSAFIGVAERAGLIGTLDLHAVLLALGQLQIEPMQRLSVNVSAATVADPDTRKAYLDQLSRFKSVVGRLTVEITETVAIKDFDVAAEFARAIRVLGCRLALDDFGQGYTSFRSLMALPLDVVKIDGLYVTGIEHNSRHQALVRAIVELARELGLQVVAERVETAEEARALAGLGVNQLQGYFFGKPIPLADSEGFEPSRGY